jgi:hypothetical protein
VRELGAPGTVALRPPLPRGTYVNGLSAPPAAPCS